MATRPTPAPVADDWQDVTPPPQPQASPAHSADDWQTVTDWQDAAEPKKDPGVIKGVWDSTVGGFGGMVKRYGVDLPAQHRAEMQDGLAKGDYLGAAGAAASYALPIVDIAKDLYHSSVSQADQAVDAAKKGDYSRAALHAFGEIPVVGPMVADTAENISDPNMRGYGLGQAIGGALTFAAPKILPKVGELAGRLPSAAMETASGINRLTPEQLITKGLRGSVPQGRTNFYQNLTTSLPAIKAVEKVYGKPIESLDDLIGTAQKPGAIQMAKRANRAEFEQMLGPQQAAGARIDLSPVADAMERSVSTKTKLENPAEAERIRTVADRYRRPFSVSDVDEFLRSTNAELNSYYGKNPAARGVAAAANPDTALLDAQGQALRDVFYKHLDAPQGGAAARQLQKEYGTLSELQDAMEKRKNVALRQAPDSLSEQLAKWDGLGDALKAGGKMLTGRPLSALGDVLTGLGKAKMAKWLKEQQATDNLIRRAFANHNTPRIAPDLPPPPVPPGPPSFTRNPSPAPFTPAGQLGPGPIITPPPPDSSGWMHGAEPRMGMGMSPNVEPELPPQQPRMLRGASPGMPEPLPEQPIQPELPSEQPMMPERPESESPDMFEHIVQDNGRPVRGGNVRGSSPPRSRASINADRRMNYHIKGQEARAANPKPTVTEGTIIRSTKNPAVRMVFKAGEWHPL